MSQKNWGFLALILLFATNSWGVRDLACEASDGCGGKGHWINFILPVLAVIWIILVGKIRTRILTGMILLPPILLQISLGGFWIFTIFVTFFTAPFFVDYVYKDKDKDPSE